MKQEAAKELIDTLIEKTEDGALEWEEVNCDDVGSSQLSIAVDSYEYTLRRTHLKGTGISYRLTVNPGYVRICALGRVERLYELAWAPHQVKKEEERRKRAEERREKEKQEAVMLAEASRALRSL